MTKTTSWGTIVYEYDGENRLLGAGTLRYAYDADGNLLSETSPYGTKTYRYSGSNRMKESRVTDLEAKTEVLTSYAYDAFGRRTLVADDGGDTMRTMYDGLSFEVFREGVAYADSSFASASSRSVPGSAMGSTNGRYVYIDDEADGRSSFVSNDSVLRIAVRYTGESAPLYAGGNRVAVNRSGNETTRGGRAYFGTDILGSVRSASGDDLVLEDRYEYDAFGVPYEGDFSSGTGAGYTGKPYDPITGLANYGYRDYSPVTARFTTVDPIRDGSNWFAYVNNDPVNFTDPFGLEVNALLVIEKVEPVYVGPLKVGQTATGTLYVTDEDTGATTSAPYMSGGHPYGDNIPEGEYDILQPNSAGHYRLEAQDSKYGDDAIEGTNQSQIRLHETGHGNTMGCVSVLGDDNWTDVNSLILNTSTSTVTVPVMNQALPWNWGQTEELTKYGTLTVVDATNIDAVSGAAPQSKCPLQGK